MIGIFDATVLDINIEKYIINLFLYEPHAMQI